MQIDEICGENAKKRQKRQKRPKLVLKNEIGGSACHFRRPKIKGVLALIFPDVKEIFEQITQIPKFSEWNR